MWRPMSECEHPMNMIECAWTPLVSVNTNLAWLSACGHFWVSIEHPLNQLSAHENLWVSIEHLLNANGCEWMPLSEYETGVNEHSISQIYTNGSIWEWWALASIMYLFTSLVVEISKNIFVPHRSKRYLTSTWQIHSISWQWFEKEKKKI